ncbi:hypothetical protein BC830DRAFT_417243 [Chytriomyces sp. MP71]|nr:hypothetical protein BC830DRAFT_417243 [Chytriomyces sp. MP71]
MHSPAYIITLISVGLSAFQASTALPVSVPDDNLPAFYQPSTSMPGRSASSSYFQSGGDAKTAATNYFMLAMNMTKSDLDVTHSHTDNVNGMHHVYFTQMYAGLPIANAVSNVAIMDNQAVSSFSAFVPNHVMESATPVHKRDAPIIPADQAVLMFAKAKGLPTVDKLVVKDEGNKTLVSGASFAMADIVASQAYYQTATNLVHVWDLKLMMHDVW